MCLHHSKFKIIHLNIKEQEIRDQIGKQNLNTFSNSIVYNIIFNNTMDKENKDNSIEIFRMKKLFKRLEKAKVSGSVVTIVIPPRKPVSDMTKTLVDQMGKAVNIKDKNNRISVVDSQNSARQRLKLYQRAPENGLILFSGKIMEQGSTTQKKFVWDFEPYKPINLSIYSCASNFQIGELKKQLLVNEPPFGFIVVDGQGALYATLQGNARDIINTFTVQLPKKHNKGGQSSVRFARLRTEKRHNYLRKVCQVATQCFISDNKCNVTGLVLAGSADFKNDLNGSEMFDPRLQCKVINVVDVSYGFQNGLNQAIEKSAEALQNVKFMKQKEIISQFFEHIAMADNLVVYGVQETMKYVEGGVVGKIICYEGLDYLRIKLKNPETGVMSTIYVKPQNANKPELYKDGNVELQKVEQQNEETSLAEWIAHHYKDFGCELEFVTDKSPEGTQFLKGFGGFGGFLRYKVDLEVQQAEFLDEDSDEDFI